MAKPRLPMQGGGASPLRGGVLGFWDKSVTLRGEFWLEQ